MFLPLVIGTALVVIGSWFSVLRSHSTIDYYRTIVRDGRKDSYARWVLFGYNAGLWAIGIGVALVLFGVVRHSMRT